MTAIERRFLILEKLSDRRHDTITNLASELGVWRNTIVNDIAVLQLFAPIQTKKGRYGGVFVAEDWYLSRRYFLPEQEGLLRKLLTALSADERKIMYGILNAYSKPR